MLHADKFEQSARDVDWLPIVGKEEWILLSKDLAISTNEPERFMLFESGVRAFLFSRQDLTADQMVAAFNTAVRRIERVARGQPAPFIARISPAGDVDVLWKLRADWRKARRRRFKIGPTD